MIAILFVGNLGVGFASNLPPAPLSGYFDNCFGTDTFTNGDEYVGEPLENKHVQPWDWWTPHDLRRAMRTGLSACRIAPHIPKLAIGHERQGLIKTYDQFQFGDEIRHALEAWEKRLLQIFEDNMIKLEAQL